MMKKIPVFMTALLIAAQLCWFSVPVKAENYSEAIESALQYRGNTSELAGSTDGDWTAFAYGRYFEAPMEGYVDLLSEDTKKRYQTKNKLSAAKSTEWHRIILSLLANGEDPFFFTDEKLNLIADGTYNRGYTISLGRQGISGWIWALIALDSVKADIPKDAFYTRDDIICEIMRSQNTDGGFSLSGNQSNADVTANVITALAPYYGNGVAYTYENAKTGVTVSETVDVIINEALVFLSQAQLEDGGFESYGDENCESSAQVIIALCTMKIDIFSDPRFIKNGNTAADAIFKYRNPDGGFSHIQGNASNAYATDQAAISLIALKRFMEGESPIYDFSALGFKESSGAVQEDIGKMPEVSDNAEYPQTGENTQIYENSMAYSEQIPADPYTANDYSDTQVYSGEGTFNTPSDHAPIQTLPAVSAANPAVTAAISTFAGVISETSAKNIHSSEAVSESTVTTTLTAGARDIKKSNPAFAVITVLSAASALMGAAYAIGQSVSARRKYK